MRWLPEFRSLNSTNTFIEVLIQRWLAQPAPTRSSSEALRGLTAASRNQSQTPRQARSHEKGKVSDNADKAQERIAEELRVAFFDFLSAVKQGVVCAAQIALERALTNAKDLPDALYCAAITKARIEAAYRA